MPPVARPISSGYHTGCRRGVMGQSKDHRASSCTAGSSAGPCQLPVSVSRRQALYRRGRSRYRGWSGRSECLTCTTPPSLYEAALSCSRRRFLQVGHSPGFFGVYHMPEKALLYAWEAMHAAFGLATQRRETCTTSASLANIQASAWPCRHPRALPSWLRCGCWRQHWLPPAWPLDTAVPRRDCRICLPALQGRHAAAI